MPVGAPFESSAIPWNRSSPSLSPGRLLMRSRRRNFQDVAPYDQMRPGIQQRMANDSPPIAAASDSPVSSSRRVMIPAASRDLPSDASVISFSMAWRRSVSAVLVAFSSPSVSTRLRNFRPRAPCSPMVFAARSAAITTSSRTAAEARVASSPASLIHVVLSSCSLPSHAPCRRLADAPWCAVLMSRIPHIGQ